MDDGTRVRTADRLRAFFDDAGGLSKTEVRAMSRVRRARTTSRSAFSVHPDRLDAVAAGRWTREHDDLAEQARRAAHHCAGGLAPFGRRRAVARVLADAGLVVVSEGGREPVLSAALTERLAAPWTEVVGKRPGGALRILRSVGPFALEHGEDRLPHDDEVERQGPVLDVAEV